MVRKVLYVTSSAEVFGGAEQSLLMLGLAARRNGCAYEVALPFEGPLADHLRSIGIPVHVLTLGVPRSRRELRPLKLVARLSEVPLAAIRLSRLIRSRGIDVVHSNTSIVISGAIAAKLAGKPHVWHVRELLSGPLWEVLRRLILRLSDRVVCVSSAVEKNMLPAPLKFRKKIITIVNGIDMVDIDSTPASPEAPGLSVAMIARINPWKGHALFLEAAQIVSRRLTGVSFYLIGGCPAQYRGLHADLVRLRDRLGLGESAHFIDHLSGVELRTLIASTQVIVLPSTKPEPFGLVIIEAMALGRPVIASAHGGPVEIINDGKDGVLVAPNNPELLAAEIIRLLLDRALCERLGRNAAEKARRLYSLEQFDQKIAGLYGSM